MATKPKPAKLPSDLRDPTGLDALERKAIQDFSGRINRATRAYKQAVESIPSELAVNARYVYQLDQFVLDRVLSLADSTLYDLLLEGGENSLWFSETYVAVAATRGIAQSRANLAVQSADYAARRGTVAQIVASAPHRRRMAMVYARNFEEMQNLAMGARTNMRRVIADGIGRGLNPRDIAKTLEKQAGLTKSRANLIARTEVTMALKRSRWDEAEDAKEEYGLNTKELYLSALSPTTRKTHAEKHATLLTIDECREWWSESRNSCNCKCSTTSVIVDKDGNPLVPAIIDRAKRAKENMAKRGYAWSNYRD